MKRTRKHQQYKIPGVIEQTTTTLKHIFADATVNFFDNGNTNHAAAIAFYSLLSIIPLVLLTALTTSLFWGSHAYLYEGLYKWLSYYQTGISVDVMARIIGKIGNNIKITGIIALFTTIWFSSFVFGAMETAFNTIFRSYKIRSFFVSKVLATAMIPLCWLVAIGLVFANYFGNLLFQHLSLVSGHFLFSLEWLFAGIAPFVVAGVFFALIYKVLPTNKISWKGALLGSIAFCLLLNLAKLIFAWYIVNFSTYDIIFGSLEKIIILLIWVFYIAFIFLFCAELVASYERHDLLLIEKAFAARNNDNLVLENLLFRRFGRLYKRGSCIFSEGEKGTALYYILFGEIILTKSGTAGTQDIVQTLKMGNFFGETAALSGEPQHFSAYATTDSEIACIEAPTWRRLLRENERAALTILREITKNARQAINTANSSLTFLQEELALVVFFATHPQGVMAEDALASIASAKGKKRTSLQAALAALQKDGVIVADEAGYLKLAVVSQKNHQTSSPLG